MNAGWYAALGLATVYALILHPTIFLLGVCVLAVYEYLLFEAQFDSSPLRFLVRGPAAWKLLPTHSLDTYKAWRKKGGIRSADKVSEGDICIICRDKPSAAFQISDCRHILCKDCWQSWIARKNSRCPQCTRCLFRLDDDRTLEKLVKLTYATMAITLPLSLIATVAGPAKRWHVITSLFAMQLEGILLIYAWQSRRDNFVEWWKPDVLGAAASEREQIVLQWISVAVAAAWFLHRAVVLETLIYPFRHFIGATVCDKILSALGGAWANCAS